MLRAAVLLVLICTSIAADVIEKIATAQGLRDVFDDGLAAWEMHDWEGAGRAFNAVRSTVKHTDIIKGLDHCIEKTFEMRARKQNPKGTELHRLVATARTHAYSPKGYLSNQVLLEEFGAGGFFQKEAMTLGMDLSLVPEECGTAVLRTCNVEQDDPAENALGTEAACSKCYIDNKAYLAKNMCLPRGDHKPGNIGGVSWACLSIDILRKAGAAPVARGVFVNPHPKPSVLTRLLKTLRRHGGWYGLAGVGMVFVLMIGVWGTVLVTMSRAAYHEVGRDKKSDASKPDVPSEDVAPLAVSAAVATAAGARAFGV